MDDTENMGIALSFQALFNTCLLPIFSVYCKCGFNIRRWSYFHDSVLDLREQTHITLTLQMFKETEDHLCSMTHILGLLARSWAQSCQVMELGIIPTDLVSRSLLRFDWVWHWRANPWGKMGYRSHNSNHLPVFFCAEDSMIIELRSTLDWFQRAIGEVWVRKGIRNRGSFGTNFHFCIHFLYLLLM